MRTLGHFEIQLDTDDRGESIQPEADQQRKLEPISENKTENIGGDTERDNTDTHPSEYHLKRKLSPLKETEGSSFEGNPDCIDSEPRLAPGFSEALNDPNLFSSRNAKDYSYEEGKHGKCASGVLGKVDVPVRDPIAQREVGGDERRDTDDGGHLIGARFGAAPGEKNLDAQDRNLNRGSYKKMENEWADALDNGDKIYAHVETYKHTGAERPDAYMGWTVTEHPDGKREWDAFSFTNESAETQIQWAEELESIPISDDIPNAMDEVYEANHYNNHDEYQ